MAAAADSINLCSYAHASASRCGVRFLRQGDFGQGKTAGRFGANHFRRRNMLLDRRHALSTALAVSLAVSAAVSPAIAAGHNMTATHLSPAGLKPIVGSTTYWAVVNSAGTLVRSQGATSAIQNEGPGTYEVDFTTDVTGCAI